MNKYLFSAILAFSLSLTLFPAAAFAEQGEPAPEAGFYRDAADSTDPSSDSKPEVTLPNTDAFQSNEDFKPYDPWYPKREQHGDYFFHVPELKNRLTFSIGENGKLKGTLYAPGVSRESGWQDATKRWGYEDSGLCFAASSSNLMAWYLNRYAEQNPQEPHDYERDAEAIFDHFRRGWDTTLGGNSMEALSWYFTGGFPSGNDQPFGNHLNGKEPGGYLLHKIKNNNTKRWSDVSYQWQPVTPYTAYGSFDDNNFPFIEDIGGMTNGAPFSTLEGFSEQIIRHLHYGACSIAIVTDHTFGGSGHAITLWGVDYDVESGLVTAIHVTDSDDQRGLFTVKTVRGDSNGGVRMENYPYHPPFGSPEKFTRIRDSMVMYSPEVIQTSPQVIIPGQITSNKYPINDQKEISEIQPNSTLDSIRADLIGQNIKAFDQKGNPVAGNSPLGTGYVLTMGNSADDPNHLTVVVSGDVNGDAAVNTADVILLQQVLTKKKALEGVFLKASVFQSHSASGPMLKDLIALKQFILGIKSSL